MPLLGGVEQAPLRRSSYLCDNMHAQMPNIHMQQHHVHETLHRVDLFEHHNVVPEKIYAYYFHCHVAFISQTRAQLEFAF